MSAKNQQMLAKLSGHIDGITRSMNEVAYSAVAVTLTRLDEESPVGDGSLWKRKPPANYQGGQFRGNWQLGVDAKPDGWFPGKIDPSGAETLAANIAAIPNHASRHNYFISNNVPYAWRIEEGWSKQTPKAMVARVRREFPAIVRKIVEDIKARGGRVK